MTTTMELSYNTIFEVTDANATIDAQIEETLNATAYDAAFYFVGDFLSGNYVQDPSNVLRSLSHLSISEAGINGAHAWLIDSNAITGSGKRTAYGNAATKSLRITSTTFNRVNLGTGSDVFFSDIISESSNVAIPMLDQEAAIPNTSAALQPGATSIADALLNAVTQSLFKQMGRTSAVNNDVVLKAGLMSKFHSAIDATTGGISENNAPDSKFFKRYLASGRYADDTTLNHANPVNYNVNDTIFRFIVKISGSALDSDGPNLTVAANSKLIFGDPAADETQVENGAYSTHILVHLRQDSRV